MGSVTTHSAPIDARRQREEFLAEGWVPPHVRPEVIESWRRSCGHGVSPDTVDVPVADAAIATDVDELVLRTAVPVLTALAARLDTTRTALVLASAQARITARWAGDRTVLAALDNLRSVPGGSLAEHHVGTNGLGTPLAVDRPLIVSGAEHFARPYLGFTCAGAPLHHPVTGGLAGVVVLVCRSGDANGLMLPLVLGAVEHIKVRLEADGAVGRPRSVVGARLRPAPGAGPAAPTGPALAAGSGAASRRLADQVRAARAFRWPLLVEGEAGTGKLHLLETMWTGAAGQGRPIVLDAALAPLHGVGPWLQHLRAGLDGDQLVVVRHVEQLSPGAARAAAALLDEALDPPGRRAGKALLAGTLTPIPGGAGVDPALAHRLGVLTLAVPALRDRREDIPDLVEATMNAAGLYRRWRPEAVVALQRGDWPGNVRQLRNVVLRVGGAATLDPVASGELPDELAPGATRCLSRIEAIERSAILADLRAAHGNKREAARRLGVSRSTLYRKLRAYDVG